MPHQTCVGVEERGEQREDKQAVNLQPADARASRHFVSELGGPGINDTVYITANYYMSRLMSVVDDMAMTYNQQLVLLLAML